MPTTLEDIAALKHLAYRLTFARDLKNIHLLTAIDLTVGRATSSDVLTTAEDVTTALQHLAYRIREDTPGCKTWDRQGTHVIFIRELVGKPLRTAVDLVVSHASDPNAKTPNAITRPFVPDVTTTSPTHAARCATHPDEPAEPFCRIHKTEHARSYGELAAKPPPQIPAGLTGADAARATGGYHPKHTQEDTQ